jgi:hypothetical protein
VIAHKNPQYTVPHQTYITLTDGEVQMSKRSAVHKYHRRCHVQAALNSIRRALKVIRKHEIQRVRELEESAEAIRVEFRRRAKECISIKTVKERREHEATTE